MIFPETFLELMDNSNARQLQCIQVLNKSKRKPATIGDSLVVCIKDTLQSNREKKDIKIGKVFRSIVISVAKKKQRRDGSTFKASDNMGVLLNQQSMPIANRIDFLSSEFTHERFNRLKSVTNNIL